MNFAAQAEQRGVSGSGGAYNKGRVAREVVFDDFPGERRGGNGFEQAKIVELVSRSFAAAEHRGLAEKITLEQRTAERRGFVERGLRFDLFG
jgi:hypothetical protein